MTRIPTDPEQIRQLAIVMAESGLTEVELSDKDVRVRVVRGVVPGGIVPGGVVPGGAIAPVAASAEAAPRPAPVADVGPGPGAVISPMVGVAFLAPEPGAANFVSVGQQVTAGQTLLLIEAMKTFNQIKAVKAGTVTRIVVQNSSPVEYGELLMIVE